MSVIFAILSVPLLTVLHLAPHAMDHGHCLAKPGSYSALFCPAEKQPNHRK